MLVRNSLRNNGCLRVAACTSEFGDQAPLSLRPHTSSKFHSFTSTFLPHQAKFIASQLLFTAFRQGYPAGGGLGHAVHDAPLHLYFSKLYAGRIDLRSPLGCLWITSINQLCLIWENEIQGFAMFADFSGIVWFSTAHTKSRVCCLCDRTPCPFCIFWIPPLYYLPDVPSQALNMSMFACTRAHSLLQVGAPVTEDLVCVTHGSTGNWLTSLHFTQGFFDDFN